MSWRAESTFVPTSKLSEEEKNFLKLSKKIRDIRKLEERKNNGDELDAKQLEKVQSLPDSIKEMIALVAKLPPKSEVLEKNPDMAELVPSSAKREAEKRHYDAERRQQQKEERERREKEIVAFEDRHTRPITDVATSADGRYIFSAAKDKLVLCWSTQGKVLKAIKTYGGHQGAVWCVDVSSQAKPRLATGAADEQVLLWPAEVSVASSGKGSGGYGGQASGGSVVYPDSIVKCGGIVKVLRWCPFEPDVFATASDKLGNVRDNIQIWRAGPPGKGAEMTCMIQELPSKANALAWSNAGGKTKVFTAHDNGYVAVWNCTTGDLLKTLKLHAAPVTAICVSGDGSTLVSASRDMTAKAVDITSRETPEIRTWICDRPLNAVAVSSEFGAGCEDGAVVMGGGREDRDITTTKEKVEGEVDAQCYSAKGEWWSSSKGHIGPIHCIRFVPGSGYITGSEDACLYVHDLYGGMLHSDNTRDGSRS